MTKYLPVSQNYCIAADYALKGKNVFGWDIQVWTPTSGSQNALRNLRPYFDKNRSSFSMQSRSAHFLDGSFSSSSTPTSVLHGCLESTRRDLLLFLPLFLPFFLSWKRLTDWTDLAELTNSTNSKHLAVRQPFHLHLI